jgi:hypothetical protein
MPCHTSLTVRHGDNLTVAWVLRDNVGACALLPRGAEAVAAAVGLVLPIRHPVAVATALALCLAGCTSAPRPHSAPPAAVSQPAGTQGAPEAPGTVHLTDYAINTDGPDSTIILTGALGDFGTAKTVKPDGSVDAEHTGQLELMLRHGTLRLDTAALNARLVAAYRHFPANPLTCSGSVTIAGTVPVVSGSGTGAYAHVRGVFELTVTVDEVDSPPCDGTGAFLEQTIIITGRGTITSS